MPHLCLFFRFVIVIFFGTLCVSFRSDRQFVLTFRDPCQSVAFSLSLSASSLAHAMRRSSCLRSTTALVWSQLVVARGGAQIPGPRKAVAFCLSTSPSDAGG